jgi:serine/threonine protein kinase
LEERNYSLTKFVQLAQQLARSVMFVHTAGFLHKGIRPETILVFDQDSAILEPNFPSTCSSFLVGFERVRRAEAQTDFREI